MSAIPKRTQYVGAPSDDDDGDIILRSSDGVDFRVHRFILSKASHIFQDMSSISQPTIPVDHSQDVDNLPGGIPAVSVTESCQILEIILKLMYPTSMPTISGLDTIKSVISALDKYGMLDKFQDTVKYALLAAAPNDPHAVYFVACRYNLLATANAVARLSLRKPRSLVSIPNEDLVHTNAMQYLLLMRFCAETTRAATTIVGTPHWLQNSIPTSRSIFGFGNRIPRSCTCALKTVSWVDHKEKYRVEVFH